MNSSDAARPRPVGHADRPGRAPVLSVRRAIATPRRRLWVFAALVLGLEAATFLARLDRDTVPFVLVLVPPVAALLVTATGGGAEVKRLFGRLGRWRVRWYWYAVALGLPLVEKLVVDVVGIAFGETTPARLVDALTRAALLVPFVVVLPAILEEFGWRGFGAQTAADAGRSPAWAALVVGAIFVLLHVPLYLPGQLYAGLPFWTLPILLLAGSVLLTWIYLRTGSVLLAGLMHASLNATVPLTWGLDPAWVWQVRAVVLPVMAIAVVFVTGWRWWLSSEAMTHRSTGGIPCRRPRWPTMERR